MTLEARQIHDLSVQRWGTVHPVRIIGRSASLAGALDRLTRIACAESHVLVTGEPGTGKGLFALALYLLSARRQRSLLKINCGPYRQGQVITSVLFDRRMGTRTEAAVDPRGLFDAAQGGMVLLDDVGQLSLQAQAMLLRGVKEGEELLPDGSESSRVDVRLVAVTNQNLQARVETGEFRADLFYRLQCLHLYIPPLRSRGDDWTLILEHCMEQLSHEGNRQRSFSPDALALLQDHDWPGNVREVEALADTAYWAGSGPLVEPKHVASFLERTARARQLQRRLLGDRVIRAYALMLAGEASFWEVVQQPYLERELSRTEVKAIVAQGLAAAEGSYKKLATLLGLPERDYRRFMDFLRRQRLKPD